MDEILINDTHQSNDYQRDWEEIIYCHNLDPNNNHVESDGGGGGDNIPDELTYHFNNPPVFIELIANICNELDLPPEVEFTCIDNYPIFIKRHLQSILKGNKIDPSSESEKATTERKVKKIRQLLRDQLLLRVVSLVSLCAKHTHINYSFNISKIHSIIQAAGGKADLNHIYASEFRVFRELNFKVKHHYTVLQPLNIFTHSNYSIFFRYQDLKHWITLNFL